VAAAPNETEDGAPPGARRERPLIACYANYFEVAHNAFEFLVDTCQVEPQLGEVQRIHRIVMSPVHAKLLALLLAESVEQFERNHEAIPDLAAADAGAGFAFTNPLEFERLAIDARRRPVPADRAARTRSEER
jgi:hypothetical protein